MGAHSPGSGAASTRPRYARITAAGSAALVTLVSVLGGLGILPASPATARPPDDTRGAPAMSVTNAGSSAARTAQSGVPPVPATSGSGRRVVFDMSGQRVWLVDRQGGHDVVARTYLV